MALQIKGSSQIQDASVSLSKIADISAGKILGRPEAASANYGAADAAPAELAGEDIRRIAELHTDDNVQFANIQGAAITAASATLSGDLDASGDVGGATATISGAASLGSASVTNNATIGGTLGLTGALTALSSGSFSGALSGLSLSSTNNTTVGGDAVISGDMSSATADITGLAEMGSADIAGAASVGSTLDVTGALTGSSATFSSALDALSLESTNDTTVGGDAIITGDMSSATADVSGLAKMGSAEVSGNASVDGNLTVEGNLLVNGDSVQVNVSTLQVEDPMIKLGQSNAADSLDLGFYGLYNDGSDKYAGLFRDQSDSGKFKLFDGITSEPSTTVADVSSNKATLVADIEGDISYANAVTFSLSGDVAGSASFEGDNSPTIAATIQDNAVQLSNIDFFLDEDDMASDSASHVASQQSIKKYVNDQVASGGQDNLEAKDMLMVDSTGKYVKVKEVIEYITISSAGEAEVDVEAEAEFDELSMIFLNGQKLRFSDDAGSSNDYYFENNASSEFKKLTCDMFEVGDEIEVRYFIKS